MSHKSIICSSVICVALALTVSCNQGASGNVAINQEGEHASTEPSPLDRGNDGKQRHIVDAPDYDQIKLRYQRHADEFNRLAIQLEVDYEITKLYCDRNVVAVTTPNETFLDGDGDPYTSRYEPLCRFTDKVAAHRSAKGIRFPHWAFEEGALFVTNYLEKVSDQSDVYGECVPPLIDEERGACAIPIEQGWVATYEWNPFCLDHMKGELGCP